MGKGTANFRTTQIQQGIPVSVDDEFNEQVKHDPPLKEFQKPIGDLEIRVAIKAWILKARKRYHLTAKQLPMPTLDYNLRIGNCLGKAWYEKKHIQINRHYLEFDDHCRWQQINETVPHEVCHLVAGVLFNWRLIAPHGKEWQNICIDLGHTPSARACNVPSGKYIKREQKHRINDMKPEDF